MMKNDVARLAGSTTGWIELNGRTALLALALLGAAGCDLFCGDERQEVYDFSEVIERLVVSSGSGDISVEAADTSVVTVEATIRGEDTHVDQAVSAGELALEADCGGCEICCSVDYVISVPRLMSASLDTGSGDVVLIGTAGDADIETGSGDVAVGCVAADELALDTGSGNIEGTRLRATALAATTGSGDISLGFELEPERVDAETGSGDIELEVPSAAYDVETDTSSGDVDVDGITVDEGSDRQLTAKTGSGDIVVRGR